MGNNSQRQSLTIISLALHFTIFIYVGIVFLVGNLNQDPINSWTKEWIIKPEFKIPFFFLSFAACAQGILAFTFHKIAGKGKVLNFQVVDAHTMTMTIIRMAMAEAIAIMGLCLSILNQSTAIVIPYAVVALITQYLVGPIHGAKKEPEII